MSHRPQESAPLPHSSATTYRKRLRAARRGFITLSCSVCIIFNDFLLLFSLHTEFPLSPHSKWGSESPKQQLLLLLSPWCSLYWAVILPPNIRFPHTNPQALSCRWLWRLKLSSKGWLSPNLFYWSLIEFHPLQMRLFDSAYFRYSNPR